MSRNDEANMITHLNPPIPLTTPRGRGLAHLVVDYGPEFHLMWTVFLDANGECWTFANPDVRAVKNITMGRSEISSTENAPGRTIAAPGRTNGVHR